MKNSCFTLILAFLCFNSFSQSEIHSNFGIEAGAQAAKLGQPEINWDTRYSWHAGLLAHLHISDHFAIQPELVYSNQGGEHIVIGLERKLELGYINVPILFQFMTGSGFRFQAGPQIGFLVDAKQEFNGLKSDIKDNLKKTDFTLLVGASYITSSGLGFDARYGYGLTDISNSDNVLGMGQDINNLLIQVGVFYQFKNK